jgi:hypothetical protein
MVSLQVFVPFAQQEILLALQVLLLVLLALLILSAL